MLDQPCCISLCSFFGCKFNREHGDTTSPFQWHRTMNLQRSSILLSHPPVVGNNNVKGRTLYTNTSVTRKRWSKPLVHDCCDPVDRTISYAISVLETWLFHFSCIYSNRIRRFAPEKTEGMPVHRLNAIATASSHTHTQHPHT